MFNLTLKGHHSQHMAIGLKGLTSGDSLSKYNPQPLNGGGFSHQLPGCQSAKGEWYRGHSLELVLYAWHFYRLVRKTMRELQSPRITIVPFSSTTKLRGLEKASKHKMINRRTTQPTLLKKKIRRTPQDWRIPGYKQEAEPVRVL